MDEYALIANKVMQLDRQAKLILEGVEKDISRAKEIVRDMNRLKKKMGEIQHEPRDNLTNRGEKKELLNLEEQYKQLQDKQTSLTKSVEDSEEYKAKTGSEGETLPFR